MISRILLGTLLLTLATFATAQQPVESRSADEAVVAGIVRKMESAWNAHDMKAYAGLFHEDGAFITFQGAYLKGRKDIETILARAHATGFRNSVSSRKIENLDFVAADVAVVHVFRLNSGVTDKPIPSRNTLVITRRDGKWGIHTFHNTRVTEPDVK
jgi:uncharacterized protein (TIGR02246 family)